MRFQHALLQVSKGIQNQHVAQAECEQWIGPTLVTPKPHLNARKAR
jgi:hypothetical protein